MLARLDHHPRAKGAFHHGGSRGRCRFPGHHHIPGHGKIGGPEAVLRQGFIHGRHARCHAAPHVGQAQEIEQALDRAVLPRGPVERRKNDVGGEGQQICSQVPVHLQTRQLPGKARERLLEARRGAPGHLSLRGRSPLEDDHMGLG